MAIHFGTSGWRAVVADEFTYAAVGRVAAGICDEFEQAEKVEQRLSKADRASAIGGDTTGAPRSFDPRSDYLADLETKTPVGFKFIGELINEDKIVLDGEESTGLSIKGHYPEKDGILACLLAAEAVAARGASLTEPLEALYSDIGSLESGRIGVRLTPDLMPNLKDRLTQEPSAIAGRRVKQINRLDGLKIIFEDDSWLLVRPSGTEPLVRIYAESESPKDMEVLLEQGRKYLLG